MTTAALTAAMAVSHRLSVAFLRSLTIPYLASQQQVFLSRQVDQEQARCTYSTVSVSLQDLVTTGRLKSDGSQLVAAKVLSAFQDAIRHSKQEFSQPLDLPIHEAQVKNQFQAAQEPAAQAGQQPAVLPYPRGVYLWGTIGSGKTMLLDLFCSSFSDADRQQFGLSRLHFHEFMLKFHSKLHSLQQSLPRIRGTSQFGLPVYRQGTTRQTPVKLLVLQLDILHRRSDCQAIMHMKLRCPI